MVQMVILFGKGKFKRGSANVKRKATEKKKRPIKITYGFSYRN